jgi:long-subunit fatty acid transport protein
MKTTLFLIVLGYLWLLSVQQAIAQHHHHHHHEEVVYNKNSWYALTADYSFNHRWGAHAEIQARRNGLIYKPQQFVFRLGANYHYTPSITFTLGASHIHKSPYGAKPAALPKSEHNIYEQVNLKQHVRRFSFQHRYRRETRWVDKVVAVDNEPQIQGKKYLHRMRYRLSVKVPLNTYKIQPGTWFLVGGNEVFINTSALTSGNTFNQNWLFGSLGYQMSHWVRIKVGYLHQLIKKSSTQTISNHTFTLGLFCHFNQR